MPWITPPNQKYFENSAVFYDANKYGPKLWSYYENDGKQVGARFHNKPSLQVAHTFSHRLQFEFRLTVQLDYQQGTSGIYLGPLETSVSNDGTFRWTRNRQNTFYIARNKYVYHFYYNGGAEKVIRHPNIPHAEQNNEVSIVITRRADGTIPVEVQTPLGSRQLHCFKQISDIKNDLWLIADNQYGGDESSTIIRKTLYEVEESYLI